MNEISSNESVIVGEPVVAAPKLWNTLLNGVKGKCPACGAGSLFSSYLKRREACPSCGESFDGLDADDGPAWLGIVISAHVVGWLLLTMETSMTLSYGVELAILLPTTVATVLLVLPPAKGLFIAHMWWSGREQG